MSPHFVLLFGGRLCLVMQVEEAADYVDYGRRFRFFGRGLQRRDRGVHDFVDDAAGQRFNGDFLFGRQLAHAAADAVDFCLTNRLQVILQADDGGDHIERLQAGLEAFDFAGDDGFGEFGFLAAVGDVARDGLLQVVDVIGENAIELAHLRRNVARDGDVDEEHWAILAAGEELLSMLAAEDGVRRAGRGDDDIGAVAGVIQIIELDGLAVESLREADGALVGAVGNEDRGTAMRHQVTGGEFAHLAGADDEDRLPFQRPENFLGEFYRNRGD